MNRLQKGMVFDMKLFFQLTGFELKKILCRKRSVITLLVVILLGIFSVFGTIVGNYYFLDENGEEIAVSRYEEEMIDRRNGEALSGRVVDADLIMEAVDAYRQVPLDKVYYDITPEYQNARKYSEICEIVCWTMDLSIDEFQQLTREQAEQFDQIRRENKEYMIENSDINMSENMKEYWRECIEKSPKTLTYEYSGGYYRYVAVMYTTAFMAAAAVAIMISGIFSEEYVSGADNLILSSKHGKGLVIGAKLLAAFGIAEALIIFLIAVSYIETMAVWGTSGADASLILLGNIFEYPITIGQSALFYSICMLGSILLFTALTTFFSAAFKTPFNTIVVMAIILIVPMFIVIPDSAPLWVFQLEQLMPTHMMAFWDAMSDLQYEIFGVVIPPYVFLPVFAIIASCVCVCLSYRIFKRHQVV
ncbi:MAG: ABC transporter permease [Lachnospiraceae bacterium]|nr:ABC transporter permease [Lachnospiraceae bacterium]